MDKRRVEKLATRLVEIRLLRTEWFAHEGTLLCGGPIGSSGRGLVRIYWVDAVNNGGHWLYTGDYVRAPISVEESRAILDLALTYRQLAHL